MPPKVFSRNQTPTQSYDATAAVTGYATSRGHANFSPLTSPSTSGSVTPLNSSSSVSTLKTLQMAAREAGKIPPKQLSEKFLESMVLLSALANADKDGDIPSTENFKNTLSNLPIFKSVKKYIEEAPDKAKSAATAAKNAAANAAADKAQAAAGTEARFKREQAANKAVAKAKALATAATEAIQAAEADPLDENKATAAEAAKTAADDAADAADDAKAAAAGSLHPDVNEDAEDAIRRELASQPHSPLTQDPVALFGKPTGRLAAKFSRTQAPSKAPSKASTANSAANDDPAAPARAAADAGAAAQAQAARAAVQADAAAAAAAPSGIRQRAAPITTTNIGNASDDLYKSFDD